MTYLAIIKAVAGIWALIGIYILARGARKAYLNANPVLENIEDDFTNSRIPTTDKYKELYYVNTKDKSGTIIMSHKLSIAQRLKALFRGRVYLTMLTFYNGVTPYYITLDNPIYAYVLPHGITSVQRGDKSKYVRLKPGTRMHHNDFGDVELLKETKFRRALVRIPSGVQKVVNIDDCMLYESFLDNEDNYVSDSEVERLMRQRK